VNVATLSAICHLDRALSSPYWGRERRPEIFVWWAEPYEQCVITLDREGQLVIGVEVNGEWLQKELGYLPTEMDIRVVLTELRIVPELTAILRPEDGVDLHV
jgi:hypothetical protein